MLIDPNTWSQDGATALAEWDPSEDGRHLLYSVQDGGTDWRTVRVLDVATGAADRRRGPLGQILQPRLGQGRLGLLLFALPRARRRASSSRSTRTRRSISTGSARRRARTGWSSRRPTSRGYNNTAEVSEDGDWLIVSSSEGTDARYEITLIDLASPSAAPRRLITGFEHDWTYLGNQGTIFYWQHQQRRAAPAHRRHRHRPARARRSARSSPRTRRRSTRRLDRRPPADRRISGRRQERGPHLRPRRRAAPARSACPASAASAASTATSRAARPSTASPASTGRPRSTATTARPARTASSPSRGSPSIPRDYEVRQVFYPSKDGTRVPMFLVHRRGLDLSRPQPTLLYGYGGFNVVRAAAPSSRAG